MFWYLLHRTMPASLGARRFPLYTYLVRVVYVCAFFYLCHSLRCRVLSGCIVNMYHISNNFNFKDVWSRYRIVGACWKASISQGCALHQQLGRQQNFRRASVGLRSVCHHLVSQTHGSGRPEQVFGLLWHHFLIHWNAEDSAGCWVLLAGCRRTVSSTGCFLPAIRFSLRDTCAIPKQTQAPNTEQARVVVAPPQAAVDVVSWNSGLCLQAAPLTFDHHKSSTVQGTVSIK